ncbi:MAG: 4-amino-4-deoxy-L-arabinose transferase-like glycosyltransferase, partial [Polyangiales bacterium]
MMSDSNDPAKLDWRDAVGAGLLATIWFLLVRPGGFDLPFFWDEADVYVPGSRWVAEHGLNVTPGVFPDDYSRGHPPLLYLLAGAAFVAFGATPTVAHLLMLPFGVVALAATYGLGASLFGRRAGIAAAL